jgi:AcrR family transcriptional regulator
MKPRIRNPQQTRAKLLKATADLVAAKGSEALSLKEAARVAKVSRGVVYQHFDDREHLLREAKTWLLKQLTQSVEAMDSRTMEEHVRQVAELVLSNPDSSMLLVTDAMAGRARNDHPLFKLAVRTLDEFKDSRAAPEGMDVDILSYIMLGSLASMVMLSRSSKGGDNQALVQRYTDEWTRILRGGLFAKTDAPPGGKKKATASRSS